MLPFSYPIERFEGTVAYENYLECKKAASTKKLDRFQHGDCLGKVSGGDTVFDGQVYPSFAVFIPG